MYGQRGPGPITEVLLQWDISVRTRRYKGKFLGYQISHYEEKALYDIIPVQLLSRDLTAFTLLCWFYDILHLTCLHFVQELTPMQNMQVSPEVPQHEAADKIPSQVCSCCYAGTCQHLTQQGIQ